MNKLQELTDKLYNDGLSKGREEGERLLEEARGQAGEIIAKARKEAEDIVSEARRQADDYSQKVKSDLKMAAAQSFQATKSDIENLIIGKFAGEEMKSTLSSADFVKQFLQAIAEKFSTDDASDLSVVLPASLQDELEPFVKGQLSKVLGKEISASFSKKLSGGFTIGPKDGGYFISMTDETFNELITEYLRPVTKRLLFG
jgi:V/A-type H+-transporting ATPase subunit E